MNSQAKNATKTATKKLNAKDRYRMLTRDLDWNFSYADRKQAFPYEEFEGIKITDWSKWEDPFRLTMDSYWKYQAEKEKKLYAIFDAFSQTSINRYAYICNMETNVSRWSVQAVKDFDLPYEYMYDAGKIWEEHIHPDDCKEYEEDIEAVFSGKKECHDLTYRARLKNGKYIKCRCEGYVLRGRTAKEPNLFAGILTRVDEAVNYEER